MRGRRRSRRDDLLFFDLEEDGRRCGFDWVEVVASMANDASAAQSRSALGGIVIDK